MTNSEACSTRWLRLDELQKQMHPKKLAGVPCPRLCVGMPGKFKTGLRFLVPVALFACDQFVQLFRQFRFAHAAARI
jgi:hypothetical protein